MDAGAGPDWSGRQSGDEAVQVRQVEPAGIQARTRCVPAAQINVLSAPAS